MSNVPSIPTTLSNGSFQVIDGDDVISFNDDTELRNNLQAEVDAAGSNNASQNLLTRLAGAQAKIEFKQQQVYKYLSLKNYIFYMCWP